MIVLSIDPGIGRLGYALFEKKGGNLRYLNSGLVTTQKKDPKGKRLLHIESELERIILRHKPTHLVMEELFFSKNIKTAIVVAQAQGVILMTAAKHSMSVSLLTPTQVKQIITGYGSSDKRSVQKMLRLTLHLEKELKQDDVADAIACGAAYCYLNTAL